MLKQLGSDYNNSLSFHGWRRSRLVQCHAFVPYHGGESGVSTSKLCGFNSVTSGQGWEEVNGRGGARERERGRERT